MNQAPTIGRIVHYRQARGSNAWLPAVVTVTEETYVPGTWSKPPVVPTEHAVPTDSEHMVNLNWLATPTLAVDRDGETFAPSALPPVKDGRVHLRVLSPMGTDYVEYNVAEGEEPGCWRWPPRVDGAGA